METIKDLDTFRRLGVEWDRLRERSGCRSPYLTAGWLAAWWEAFGAGKELRVGLERAGTELVAGAPLMFSTRTLSGVPVKAVHFLGTNIAFGGFVVTEKGDLGRLLDAALEETRAHVLLAKGIPEGSEGHRRLEAYLDERGLRHTVARHGEIYLDTSGGLEAYEKARRSKFWSNVRNRRRRLEKLGTVTFDRWAGSGDPAELVREMGELSLKSWKGERGTAIGLLEEHLRFTEALLRDPGGEAWLLRLNGQAIAYRLLYRAGPVAAEIDIAYDEAQRRLSPGTLLGAESNRALIEEGVEEISLGMDFPWKQEWSPTRRSLLEFVVFRRGLRSRLLGRIHQWRLRHSDDRTAVSG